MCGMSHNKRLYRAIVKADGHSERSAEKEGGLKNSPRDSGQITPQFTFCGHSSLVGTAVS